MKKFGLLLLGGIAAIVLLHNLGPMVGMVISLSDFLLCLQRIFKDEFSVGKDWLGNSWVHCYHVIWLLIFQPF